MSRMACIPTRGTSLERRLIAALRRTYDGPLLTHVVGTRGTPDVLLPDKRVVLAAMGCYWHWHPADGCPIAHVPSTGPTGFDWLKKLDATRVRDVRNRAALLAGGYRVAWIWECSVFGSGALSRPELDARLAAFISGEELVIEVEGKERAARQGPLSLGLCLVRTAPVAARAIELRTGLDHFPGCSRHQCSCG